MSCRQEKKEDKRGSNKHEERISAIRSLTTSDSRFLPSDPSPQRTQGFCHQIPHYGPYADRLPWACYLRPAASSWAYSVASSWTRPVPAPSRCPRPASLLLLFGLGPSERHATGLLPDPGAQFKHNSCFFLSFLSLAFPSPSPQSVIVSVLPFLHLPY